MHLGTEYESSLTRTQGRDDNNNSDMNLKPVNDLPFLFSPQLALRKCGNTQSWKSAIGDVTKGTNSCLSLSSTPREAQLMHGHLVLGSFNMQEGPTKHLQAAVNRKLNMLLYGVCWKVIRQGCSTGLWHEKKKFNTDLKTGELWNISQQNENGRVEKSCSRPQRLTSKRIQCFK